MGADAQRKDVDGLTPLQLARLGRHERDRTVTTRVGGEGQMRLGGLCGRQGMFMWEVTTETLYSLVK